MALELTRRTVTHGDVDLAVVEGGDPAGPTIVFVHGWPDTHVVWTGVMELLAPEFHVAAYDLRGMGASSDPGDVRAFTVAEQTCDLWAVIDAVSPSAPVHVVAHDWGSVFAWDAVGERYAGDRVASFTTLSGPSLEHMALYVRGVLRSPTVAGLRDVAGQLVASWYVYLFLTPLARVLLTRYVDRARWERFLARVEGCEPQPWHHAATFERDIVSGLRFYRANVLAGLCGRPRRRRTSVPVLQLLATRDIAVRESAVRASEPWVADLDRRAVPFGHWVALARPDVVAAHVRPFVRRVEARRAA